MLTFRPSRKILRVTYIGIALLFLGAVALWYQFIPEQPPALLILPALLFFIPLRMHIRLLAMKLTLEGDHLVLESGLMSKTTRTLNIGKVQDVTVRQTVTQRMLGLGDITVETAGEGSALTARNFDRPKDLADRILRAAHEQSRAAGL